MHDLLSDKRGNCRGVADLCVTRQRLLRVVVPARAALPEQRQVPVQAPPLAADGQPLPYQQLAQRLPASKV